VSTGYPQLPPPGQVNPQIAQTFYSVDRNGSGRIDAMELQQALVNADWSQFNPEICKMMIGKVQHLITLYRATADT
jgi:hypothetical protein